MYNIHCTVAPIKHCNSTIKSKLNLQTDKIIPSSNFIFVDIQTIQAHLLSGELSQKMNQSISFWI